MKFLSTLLLLTFFGGAVQANPHHFALKGEALFFKPSLDDTIFVTTSTITTTTIDLSHRELDPGYKTGFRIAGFWSYDCGHDLQIRYTHFNSGNYRRSYNGPITSEGFLLIGDANSRLNFRYNAVDALLGSWVYDSCDFDLNFAAGLHYANIRVHHFTDYGPFPTFPTALTTDRRARFWGIGPEVCFDFHYLFSSCFVGNFGLTGYARGALLSSRAQVHTTNGVTAGASTFYRVEPKWSVVPAADLRLGLDWGFSCACFNGSVETGYEWIWYRKAVRHTNIAAFAPPDYSDVSFQGPYLSIGVIF